MTELDIFFDRRSIRRYRDIPIEKEKIELLLKAAMYAPSAVNKQPWHFIVIDDREIMQKISEIHPYARMLLGASHAILVCGDETLQHDDGYWIVDCGAATENLLLAAHALGLGGCWIGIQPREARKLAVSKLFSLPAYVKPFAIVSLGYPDETKNRPERYHPDKIHLNAWGIPFSTR